ncbi:MAG: hypothetical protein LC796_07285 [Acidobacteria bacterium]|nr:hypothetical protein [Acidobacteriota bacterium]MCA1610433.1 hypothetical protein [Acidobacteriota bacterium]
MTHSSEARSPRESGDRVRFESHGKLIDTLGEVLASSARESFEVRMTARLWLEKNGEAAARALASASTRPERLEADCDCRQEQPLAVWENDFPGLPIQTGAGSLTPREIRVLRSSPGIAGRPRPLARIAPELGLRRERVRQIESGAPQRLGIRLPKGMHRRSGGRWKRARIVLRKLASLRSPFPGTTDTIGVSGSDPLEVRP